MPGKEVQCKHCSKFMRSDNLKRHAKSCHHSQVASTSPFNAPSVEGRVSTGNNKRAITAEIISDSDKSDETDHHPRNRKIQKLVNEIINDDVISAAEVTTSPLERFDHKVALSTTTSQGTPEVIPPSSRNKGDIIGYSGDDHTKSMGRCRK